MKLRTFLDQLFDETWVCITDTEGHKHYLWMADYIGWYREEMEPLEPLLNKQIDPDVYIKMEKNPETKRGKVPIIHIELYVG